jgi:hypothetical protein
VTTSNAGTINGILTDGASTFALEKTCVGQLTLGGNNSGLKGASQLPPIRCVSALVPGLSLYPSGATLTYAVNTTGARTVTVNTGGVVNLGGFAHTGTTFVNS